MRINNNNKNVTTHSNKTTVKRQSGKLIKKCCFPKCPTPKCKHRRCNITITTENHGRKQKIKRKW